MSLSLSPLLTGKRVVVVEDEAITQMQMQRILTRAGMVVAGYATRGEDAVEIILRERPDLVTMDLSLKGMDGIEVTRRIRESFSTCVVMMSAYNKEAYEQQALDAGASGYIVKPVTADLVIPALEEFYRQWHAKQSAA